MKNIAFGIAVLIVIFGLVGILTPAAPAWVAQHVVTSTAFYVIAAIRVVFGIALISAASASRAPKTIRVLGYLVLISGIVTALTGMFAIEQARAIIEGWTHQGQGMLRLACVVLTAFGGVIAYACAPARRAN